MNEFYFLGGKVKKSTAFAYTQDEIINEQENIIVESLKDITKLPFEMFLRKVEYGKNGLLVSDDLSELKYLWQDYQPNNLAWPLMSNKLKDIIVANLTGEESISWLEVKVVTQEEIRNYYIPRFEKKLDVLDLEKTKFVPGTNHVIFPVFSLNKIENFNMFHLPQLFWKITSSIYVHETIKKAIQKEKLTGMEFEEISLA